METPRRRDVPGFPPCSPGSGKVNPDLVRAPRERPSQHQHQLPGTGEGGRVISGEDLPGLNREREVLVLLLVSRKAEETHKKKSKTAKGVKVFDKSRATTKIIPPPPPAAFSSQPHTWCKHTSPAPTPPSCVGMLTTTLPPMEADEDVPLRTRVHD